MQSFRSAQAEDFDWRDVGGQNWVTSVKSQFGGTCWAFAACGVIEAKYMLTRNDNSYQPNVSEQQVVWETNPDMGDSVDGGSSAEALDYFTDHGVVLESECPYQSSSPDVGIAPYWPLASGWQNRVFKSTSDVTKISQGTNLAYVKSCLKKYGPLEIYIRADDDFYIPDPGSYRGGHRVVIVGFHDDASVPGGGYWIIKNSWGSGWNSGGPGTINHGYGAIAYADQPSYEDVQYEWWDVLHLYPDYNYDVGGINGAVYFTGPMATVTWKGGSAAWVSGGNNWTGSDMYGNSLPTYAWENKETNAIFNASSVTNINLSGKVIAHGVTISSGATGYVFNGVNNPSLTVTSGGITAHETVTIGAPVTVGAPQSWTVDAGKTLTIGGLHTIISHLDINGNGDTTITGAIDGGGVLNTMGVAPGTITKNGSGTLHLTGASTYSVPITASGFISFEQAGSDVANFTSSINGSVTVTKSNTGTIILSGDNNYTGWTRAYVGGVIQADLGVGLPNESSLILNGGVFQSNSTITFADKFRDEVSGTARWLSWWDGGFAGGGGKLTVNLRNDGSTVKWTGHGDSGLYGIMRLNSNTAQHEVELVNSLDLNAGERTFYVDDNPDTDDDLAVISGVITDSSGGWTGGIRKTGPGTLVLTARNENGVGDGSDGNTTIADGVLEADRDYDHGLSGWAGLILEGGVLQSHGGAVTYAEPLWAYGSGALRV
ncbi:MAG: autotransporter-associated beta strand repeat-containing protein, partial [Pirellulales bacterium]|nr:autotransporter-associated beta strand repeat-containing protein [Pirellulales bacterium]